LNHGGAGARRGDLDWHGAGEEEGFGNGKGLVFSKMIMGVAPETAGFCEGDHERLKMLMVSGVGRVF